MYTRTMRASEAARQDQKPETFFWPKKHWQDCITWPLNVAQLLTMLNLSHPSKRSVILIQTLKIIRFFSQRDIILMVQWKRKDQTSTTRLSDYTKLMQTSCTPIPIGAVSPVFFFLWNVAILLIEGKTNAVKWDILRIIMRSKFLQ